MSAALDRLRSLLPPVVLPGGEDRTDAPARWSRRGLAGRLAELSAAEASAALTLAFSLVWDAQREGEPVAWIAVSENGFYPPDAADNGIDLEALAVVRVADSVAAGRAAGHLARSGAFGLIVLDLVGFGVDGRVHIPQALLGRLAQQALRHDTAILCLTEKPAHFASLGSLVSLRGQARRRRTAENRFTCSIAISKDKRKGPGWTHDEGCHGPPGLR